MTDLEDAKRILRLAKVDQRAMRNMMDPELFDESIFGFHAQQAAEKGLKSWLSLVGILYPRTHDLRYLMSLLQDRVGDTCLRFEGLTDLTDFAVQFRYDFFPGSADFDRAKIADSVDELIGHVEQLLHADRPTSEKSE